MVIFWSTSLKRIIIWTLRIEYWRICKSLRSCHQCLIIKKIHLGIVQTRFLWINSVILIWEIRLRTSGLPLLFINIRPRQLSSCRFIMLDLKIRTYSFDTVKIIEKSLTQLCTRVPSTMETIMTTLKKNTQLWMKALPYFHQQLHFQLNTKFTSQVYLKFHLLVDTKPLF